MRRNTVRNQGRGFSKAVKKLSQAHAAEESARPLVFTRITRERFLELGLAETGRKLHEVLLTKQSVGSGKGSHWQKHWKNFTDADWRETERLVQTGRDWNFQPKSRIRIADMEKGLVVVIEQKMRGRRGLFLKTAFHARDAYFSKRGSE